MFWIGLGIAVGGFFIGLGLEEISTAIRENKEDKK